MNTAHNEVKEPDTSPANDRFSAILNVHEIRLLIREGQHLKCKREERSLTKWESERLVTLVDELSKLVRDLVAAI